MCSKEFVNSYMEVYLTIVLQVKYKRGHSEQKKDTDFVVRDVKKSQSSQVAGLINAIY